MLSVAFMPTWDSAQYLRFGNERTQPSIDLAGRITLAGPMRIVDLGCGPGNSTSVVAQRWPKAAITGVDNSAAMLTTARKDFPAFTWEEHDIAAWAAANAGRGRYDLVFSNAALQWVPNHAQVVPQIFDSVASGGALAFQVPHSLEAPHQRCIRDLAASAKWRSRFVRQPLSWHVEPSGFYYDLLAPRAAKVDLWFTDYLHQLEGPEGVVEWHRGTGLRPFLDHLPDDDTRAEFLRDYLAAITPHYPRQKDGRVLMAFRRFFVIAYRRT